MTTCGEIESKYEKIKLALRKKLSQWMQEQNDLGMKSELSVKAHSKVKNKGN